MMNREGAANGIPKESAGRKGDSGSGAVAGSIRKRLSTLLLTASAISFCLMCQAQTNVSGIQTVGDSFIPAAHGPDEIVSQTNQAVPKYEYKIEGGSILGPVLKWPLKGSDAGRDGGSLWPLEEGSKLLNERWKHGAKANLSTNNTAAIRKVVLDKFGKSKPEVGEIRKITEREYMVQGSYYFGPLGSGGFYFVLVRSESKWILIGQYYIWIS